MADLEAGTWTELIGGVAGVAAFIVATLTLRYEWASRRREEAERRRAQASAIAIWCTKREPHPNPGWGFAIKVMNASAQPIYDLRVDVLWEWEHLNSGPPDTWWREVLLPGSLLVVWEGDISEEQYALVGDPPFDLRFRDSASVSWHRPYQQDLVEARPLLPRRRRRRSRR
jgi:hypothetical protein